MLNGTCPALPLHIRRLHAHKVQHQIDLTPMADLCYCTQWTKNSRVERSAETRLQSKTPQQADRKVRMSDAAMAALARFWFRVPGHGRALFAQCLVLLAGSSAGVARSNEIEMTLQQVYARLNRSQTAESSLWVVFPAQACSISCTKRTSWVTRSWCPKFSPGGLFALLSSEADLAQRSHTARNCLLHPHRLPRRSKTLLVH